MKTELDSMIPDIQALISTRPEFDRAIYSTFEEAITELERRRKDPILQEKIKALLGDNIPIPLQFEPRAILFRHIATPNYEVRRFFTLLEASERIKPLFFEYSNDKFVTINEEKHALGKLLFYAGQGKKGGAKIDSLNIIDFNAYNGKKISEVKTLWGESLFEFHHELFARFREEKDMFFDASEWFASHGTNAAGYYPSFLLLFVLNGILFENFLLDAKGVSFTKEVFLPAFQSVIDKVGVKPLIVNLEPTEIENDAFWLCHPHTEKEFVLEKLGITPQKEK